SCCSSTARVTSVYKSNERAARGSATEHRPDAVQRLSRVVFGHAQRDPHVAAQPEMRAGHDQDALLGAQALREDVRLDRRVIADHADGAGRRLVPVEATVLAHPAGQNVEATSDDT